MMASSHDAKTLSIGTLIEGRTPRNLFLIEALDQLTRDVVVAREGIYTFININVEFQVAGNFPTPDFDGVRTGTFRRADRLLKVQVAVHNEAPNNPRLSLIEMLKSALDLVDSWAVGKNQQFETSGHRVIIASLESKYC